MLWVINNFVFMVSKNWLSGRIVYDDLKFGVFDLVEEVFKEVIFDWFVVFLEKLVELDVDYIIFVNSDKDVVMFNELSWKNFKVVKDNYVL